jgi:hypothetical protein
MALPLVDWRPSEDGQRALEPPPAHEDVSARTLDRVLIAQGAYYVATGLWSLVSIRTFQWVTGPKTDTWLVKTVGVLVMAIGAALVHAGLTHRRDAGTAILSAGTAAGLTGVEAVYVARRRISPVYLADAVLQCTVLGAWLAVHRKPRHPQHAR